MLVAPGGRDHLETGKSSDSACICVRTHHVLRRVAIQIDDLQDDLLLRLRQRTLLETEFEQLGVLPSPPVTGNRIDLARPIATPGSVELTASQCRGRVSVCGAQRHRTRHPQRPKLRRSHRQRLRDHLASNQDQDQNAKRRRQRRPFLVEHHPQPQTHQPGALANVFPRTIVASKSCGVASRRATHPPAVPPPAQPVARSATSPG